MSDFLEPQESPAKRVLTEDLHTASKSQIVPGTAISEDLVAQIRSRSSRVRQSVTEGYSSERGSSTYSSPTKYQSTSASTPPIFQSTNDILRDVYTHYTPGLQTSRSPFRKRQRARSEEPESTSDSVAGDSEMQMDDHELPSFAGFKPDSMGDGRRPMKPLRRRGHAFTQSRSLPVGSFKFSDKSQSKGHEDMDDDWSKDPFFGTSTAPLQLDIEF